MNCVWGNFSAIWDSGGSTSAEIVILQPLPLFGLPGALAIDDLYFGPLCKVEDTMTIHMTSMQAVAAPPPSLHFCEGYEITLSGDGSSHGPFINYQWTTPDGNIVSGANTLNPVVNAPGTYTLLVTLDDGNYQNCTATASTVVVEAVNQMSAWISTTQTLNCVQKQMTLSANANTSGNHSYQWTASNGGNIVSGASAKNALINAAGTYSVVITELNTGCTAVAESEIQADTVPPLAVARSAPITCLLPEVTLSGAGSSSGPGIYYAWSTPNGSIINGQDSIIARTDTAGIYILKVTNAANFCIDTDTVTVIFNNTPPELDIAPADSVSCLQSSVTLIAAEDTSNVHLVYSWTTESGNIVSGDSSRTPTVNAPGWYVLLLRDTLNGCSTTDSVQVAANTDAIIAIANAPEPLTCTNLSVSINANGSTLDPTLIYQWTTDDGNIVSGADTPTPVVDQPGAYRLILSNPGNGCSATDLAVVALNETPPPVSIAEAPEFTCTVTAQNLDGQNAAVSGNFTYLWTASDGGNIVSGNTTLEPEINAAGTYTLLATNTDNGCTATAVTQVGSDYEAPDTDLAVSGALHCNAASVSLTNTSNINHELLEHVWKAPDGATTNTGTNPALSAGLPGTYLLVLTNTQNGCTATAQVNVIQNEVVEAGLSAQTDVSCFGASDGALSVAAAGGDGVYTYLWTNGTLTPNAENLPAGAYTVVVTDGTGCTATFSATVTQPEAVLPNATAVAPTVVGGNDGSAAANPSGGTQPYTFEWSTGATQAVITGLIAGFYTVTVIDDNGCTAEQTVEVWDGGCDLALELTAGNPACFGSADGSATAIPLGGSAPFSYLWSNGSTKQTADQLKSEVYSVTITDVNGCETTSSIALNDPPLLTLDLGAVTDATCPESPDGSATVLPGGGTGNITVIWSGGQEGPVATGLPAGTYTATATDENGCTAAVEITVSATDLEPPTLLGGPITLPLGPAGVISLNLQNLSVTATDNCALNDVVIVPGSFDCLQLGTHPVIITAYDESGNSADLTIQVTVIDNLPPLLTCPESILRCADDRIVQYLAPVATDNCLMLGGFFNLVNGLPSGSEFPTGTTVTTYTFTDASSNVSACSFSVTILTPIAVTLDVLLNDVGGQGVGSVQVSVAGSQPGYTFEWQRDGQTVAATEDLFGLGAGTYTLKVTDEAGCTTVAGPFVVDDLVGTKTPDWAGLVAVYPNPSTGLVNVVLPDGAIGPDLRFAVFDATGRLVLEQNAAVQKRVLLDWSAFADGLYVLLIRTEQGQAAYRVALER